MTPAMTPDIMEVTQGHSDAIRRLLFLTLNAQWLIAAALEYFCVWTSLFYGHEPRSLHFTQMNSFNRSTVLNGSQASA
jgi:hypothetical protein